jgi:nucleotide-binding universal stress UspA family protein
VNEVIVGVDGSTTARAAAEQAVELANRLGRPLHVVMAVTRTASHEVRGGGSERFRVDMFAAAEQTLQALVGELHTNTPVTTAVVIDDPATALCEQALLHDASVIVVGNKRVQGAARILGSIAGDVAKAAPCNVFIVHTF